MIQFNLLPDVKLEYIRARRSERLVFSIAIIVTGVSVAILLIMLSVGIAQKKHLSDLNRDITSESSQLQKKPQIDKILTVQNQLESLGALHDTKPAGSRLFDYLNQVTPVEVSITDLTVKFTEHTATITGTADALSSVNKYVDTLKFTKYSVADGKETKPAFSDVVLSTFALGDASNAPAGAPPTAKATYTITLAYDPLIFDITQKIQLTVPAQVTTRSELEKPTDLFTTPPATSTPSTTTGGVGR